MRCFPHGKKLPCIVLTRGIKPHKEVIEAANALKIPLMRSGLVTAHLIGELFTGNLAWKSRSSRRRQPFTARVDERVWFGCSDLVCGDSGIGKSECALELLKRGHMLVADDVVEVKQRLGGVLYGTGAELIRQHMELRGVGIIDVQKIFGVGSVLDRTRIELVIRLEEWKQTVEYDRVGLSDRTTSVLGVRVPEIVMPVRPGRNLAVLVEVATLNERLKFRGEFTAKEFNQKLISLMAKKSAETKKERTKKAS